MMPNKSKLSVEHPTALVCSEMMNNGMITKKSDGGDTVKIMLPFQM